MLKMKKNRITVVLIISLTLLSTPSIAGEKSVQFKEATAKVSELLVDPGSAMFRDLRVAINSKGQESVCGEVNARNRFGGYTGFSKFNMSGGMANIVDMEREETIQCYRLSGCAGPEAELEVRLEDEAFFNCNVIWNLLANIIVRKEDKEIALDAAILATKNRAKENGAVLSEEQLQMIRSQYRQTLEQTLANKQQVKAIKKDHKYQEKIFISTCTANTLNILKERTGIKP